MSELRGIPSLDELDRDPLKATTLPTDVAKALLVKVANLYQLLFVSAFAAPPSASANGADHFLDASAVGAMIGKSKSWVEKNTETLPKRRKVGGEGMWSEREIQAWMKHRETWD